MVIRRNLFAVAHLEKFRLQLRKRARQAFQSRARVPARLNISNCLRSRAIPRCFSDSEKLSGKAETHYLRTTIGQSSVEFHDSNRDIKKGNCRIPLTHNCFATAELNLMPTAGETSEIAMRDCATETYSSNRATPARSSGIIILGLGYHHAQPRT